ncbi:hypothetical protein C8R46DRAFT_1145608 [Mycena filopes]|nr:hypothetical protein C8R46DRAFT_1145608 [Mycena filopes]
MRLIHPRLPWPVDVALPPASPYALTVADVLHLLYAELQRPIGARDFWNEVLGRREREGVTRAFKARCALWGEEARREMGAGVRRVDFLGEGVVFVGLVRGRGGVWEVRTEGGR